MYFSPSKFITEYTEKDTPYDNSLKNYIFTLSVLGLTKSCIFN